MVAINNYSVSLSLEAGNYIKNSQLSRSETTRLRREIGMARTPAEKYELALSRLDRALKEGAIDLRTYNRLLDAQKQKLSAATKPASGLATKIAGMATAYVSVGHAVRFFADGVRLAAEAEQNQVAFEVMLKDAKLAESLLKNLQAFAASTPFSQQEITKSARSLIAFGFSAEEVNKQLMMLGNISAGTGTNIGELSDIIGKMRVQGVIMSEDLNQLAGRGINVFDGLAKRLGITTDQVKKFASQSKISFEDLNAVLGELADSDFGGMMAKQAETLQGRWSTFNDELAQTKKLMAEIFVLGGDAGDGVASATGVLQDFKTGLANLPTGKELLTKGFFSAGAQSQQMLSDSERIAAESALDLAERRQRKRGESPDRFAEDLAKTLSDQAKNRAAEGVGQFLKDGASTLLGGGEKAATAVGAGLQNLGMQIAGSFKFHTEKLAKALDTSLVPAFEMGSAETAQAILKAQNDQINMERKDDNEKKEREKKSLIAVEKTASLLEEQLLLWKGGEGISKKIR